MIWNEYKRKIQKNYDDEKNILNIVQSNQDTINLIPLTISKSNKKLINYESDWIDAIEMNGGKVWIPAVTIQWGYGEFHSPTYYYYPRYLNFVIPLNIPKDFISYISSFIIYDTSQIGLNIITSEYIQEIESLYYLNYSCVFKSDSTVYMNPIRVKLIIQIYNPFKIKNL